MACRLTRMLQTNKYQHGKNQCSKNLTEPVDSTEKLVNCSGNRFSLDQ